MDTPIINLDAYRKEQDTKKQDELANAIQNLIQRLRESNPIQVA